MIESKKKRKKIKRGILNRNRTESNEPNLLLGCYIMGRTGTIQLIDQLMCEYLGLVCVKRYCSKTGILKHITLGSKFDALNQFTKV